MFLFLNFFQSLFICNRTFAFMNMSIKLSILFLGLGCGQKSKPILNEYRVSDSLRSEAERVHDSIMPLSGELMRLKKSCLESNQPDSLRIMALALENAYESMMNWMHGYSVPDSGIAEKDRIAHFAVHLADIREVGRKYAESMDNAQRLLNSKNEE
jgi:hypothetical protein